MSLVQVLVAFCIASSEGGPGGSAPRSNGLGQRIGWQYDTDADGTVETTGTDDPWTYALYNERWQLIGEHTADDGTAGAGAADDPDKLFVHHGAGLGGRGGSSYIDDVIMADDDKNDDGVLEERTYYVQNWRHDVVALTEPDGDVIEVTDFTLYGETIDVLVGDLDRDGDVDSTDTTAFNIAEPTADCGSGGCPSDFDRDNDVDGDDAAFLNKEYGDEYRDTVGVSLNARAHGRGYAGYKSDKTMPIYHVRHRAYRPDLGKWTKRDPAGYVDGGNVYAYARGNAVKNVDAMGLCARCGQSQPSDGTDPEENEQPWDTTLAIVNNDTPECDKLKKHLESDNTYTFLIESITGLSDCCSSVTINCVTNCPADREGASEQPRPCRADRWAASAASAASAAERPVRRRPAPVARRRAA